MDNRNIKDDAEEKDSRTLELLKIRSVSADIRDGIRLYLNNFRSIFRSSWLAALFYALVTGGMMTYCIGNVTNLLKMQMEDVIEILSAAKAPKKDGKGNPYVDICNFEIPLFEALQTESRKIFKRAMM